MYYLYILFTKFYRIYRIIEYNIIKRVNVLVVVL
jgi:hypothetical protein